MKKAIKTVATCWAAYFVTSYVLYGVSDCMRETGNAMLESKKAKMNGEEPVNMEAKFVIAKAIDNFKEFGRITKEYVNL